MDFTNGQIPASASGKVDEICRRVMSFTVPFLRFEHERLEHEASGVLLRIADSAFVLTAFHVLKPLLDARIPIMIGAGSQDSAGISLSGLRVLKADDPLDIALIELSPEKSEQIVFANSCINLVQCDISHFFDPRQLFLVWGFPSLDTLSSTARKTLHLAPFGFITGAYAGDTSQIPAEAYRHELHLLLDYSEGHRKDEYGEPIPPPEPPGMSGCGVWKLQSPDIPVESWRCDRLRLVAIVHSMHSTKRVLIATRLKYVLQLLYQNRPDLRNSMRISLPALT